MTPEELIAHDAAPDWFVPEQWHMLIEGTSMLPVLVKTPTMFKADSEFAVMQFTYLNTSTVDLDITRVATFCWDAQSGHSVLRIDNTSSFTLAPSTTFMLDRMVSRIELAAAR
jgi:hypothetical protein